MLSEDATKGILGVHLAGIELTSGYVDEYTRHIRYTYMYTQVNAMILGMLSTRSSFFGSPTEYIPIAFRAPWRCFAIHMVLFFVYCLHPDREPLKYPHRASGIYSRIGNTNERPRGSKSVISNYPMPVIFSSFALQLQDQLQLTSLLN